MRRFASCFFILITLHFSLHAQEKDRRSSARTINLTQEERDLWDDAEYYYDEKNYLDALRAFEKLATAHPKDPYFNMMTGICYMYKSDEKEKAISYLLEAEKLNNKMEDLYYYLGRAYHLNYKFDDAVKAFNLYISKKPPAEKKKTAEHYIEYCNNAREFVENETEVQIDNMGQPVNTNDAEYVPVVSADESVLIFTYRGPRSTGGRQNERLKPDSSGIYYEDVFISFQVKGQWQPPQPIGKTINTKGHDASIALSSDGQKLFLFKSTLKDKGDIYMSTLSGTEWSEPKRLGKNINTNFWEGSVCLSPDESTLYFSSERPGGFGGRDLYVSHKDAKGEWGPAQNLGPKINTPYNDDAPFLHADGKTLYFSSEGHKSMGGYDVFYSVLSGSGATEPVSLGYPVNTTEDDLYYVISPDGDRAYFSSNRKGGYGLEDIYIASGLNVVKKPVLALVVGVVTMDGKPIDATIHVSDSTTGDNKGTYHSNSSSGKYVVALTPGVNYKVAFEVEGQEHVEYVNVEKIETFVQTDFDVKFKKTGGNDSLNLVVADTSRKRLENKINSQINKYKEENKPNVCQARVYQKLILQYGGVKKEGVSYTVELGTYENAGDFSGSKISELGTIQSQKDALGHTIFTIGSLPTLVDADQLRQKVAERENQFANAYVSVMDHGKRQLLTEYYLNDYLIEGCDVSVNPKVIPSKSGVFSLQDDKEYDNILKDNGTRVIDGLEYKIEIGSVTDTNDFKLKFLEKYGPIQKKKYPDGQWRYTMGPFQTLLDAENFKKMLKEKEPQAYSAFITVFYFGQPKTVPEYKDIINNPPLTTDTVPCPQNPGLDFSAFIGKDLNDKEVYAQFMAMGDGGNFCVDGLIFKVQIGAYRHPENFKYPQMKPYGPAQIIAYPDGITRFTLKEFKTLREAEAFRQVCIRKGITDAWITAVYKGKRMLLTELIAVNFFGKKLN